MFAAEGADSIHAGGGGGSEVYCPAGAGAPLGHRESSVYSVHMNGVVTSSPPRAYSFIPPLSPRFTQDDGLCENDHQLSVAGKIKKHFNTSPKGNDTTAGVSVISVSHRYRDLRVRLHASTVVVALICAELDSPL